MGGGVPLGVGGGTLLGETRTASGADQKCMASTSLQSMLHLTLWLTTHRMPHLGETDNRTAEVNRMSGVGGERVDRGSGTSTDKTLEHLFRPSHAAG